MDGKVVDKAILIDEAQKCECVTLGKRGVKRVRHYSVMSQGTKVQHITDIITIIINSNLSNDRSKASSKTIPPHSAI